MRALMANLDADRAHPAAKRADEHGDYNDRAAGNDGQNDDAGAKTEIRGNPDARCRDRRGHDQ